jgi:hypothetical protein
MPTGIGNLNRREFVKKSLLAGTLFFQGGFRSSEIKKVALIGDSIRTGYQEIVEGFLKESAVIWGPEDDMINTIGILENIKIWITNDHFDVIHINSGLNDIRTIDYPGQDHLIPPDLYARNVESIIRIINKYSPGTIIVWATTTPVVDNMFNEFFKAAPDFQLKNEDVILYNDKAKNIVSRMGAAINDLYGYIMTSDPGFIMLNDGVHYTNYGYELIGERTSDVIRKILNNI